MDSNKAYEIINALNEYAINYDGYEYGLPVHGEHIKAMSDIIIALLEGSKTTEPTKQEETK